MSTDPTYDRDLYDMPYWVFNKAARAGTLPTPDTVSYEAVEHAKARGWTHRDDHGIEQPWPNRSQWPQWRQTNARLAMDLQIAQCQSTAQETEPPTDDPNNPPF